VKRTLLLKNGLDKGIAGKIQGFFGAYNPKSDGDPNDFAQAKMAADPSITADVFLVAYVFSLTKVGARVPHDGKRKAALGLITGSTNGRLYDESRNEHPLGEYLQQKQTNYKLFSTVLVGKPSANPKPKDPVHEVTGNNANAGDLIDGIMQAEAKKTGCEGQIRTDQWPLLTLAVWPEVKVTWKDVDINIGCGVHIVLRLPWIYFRTSRLDLWVYVRIPADVAADIDKIISTCLRNSALAPPVLAVALFDLPSAIGIFLGLFTDCVTSHAFKTFSCMIPGLALITAVNPPDWP
jgi:hypothetical protein